MWVGPATLGMLLATFAWAQPDLAQIQSRLAEEAEVLQQNAPKSLTRETLVQRAQLPPSRFRPRGKEAAAEAAQPRFQVREIISEYSVGPLKQAASPTLVEFRQTMSVDGRAVQSAESARHALSLGVRSPDDRLRKRMLEDFARHGLVDLATDYGLILLAFSKRGMEQMQVEMGESCFIGADEAVAIGWKQTSSEAGVLEFQGKMTARRALQGTLWVRASDALPLRIYAWTEHSSADNVTRDEATVDYTLSSHGFLTPTSVVHRHVVNGNALTENLYRYDPFKLFVADTEIKFTEVPDMSSTKTDMPPTKK